MAVNKKTGTMKNPVKMGAQMIKGLKVKWSHLAKPDLEYNSGHSVTVEMNDELKKLHKEMQAQTGVKHINGLSEYEGVETAKFSTKVYVNEGVEKFPSIFDTDGQKTMDAFYTKAEKSINQRDLDKFIKDLDYDVQRMNSDGVHYYEILKNAKL